MKLHRLEIRNFRNFRHFDIRIGQHAVIVGENKVGKSNLLFALRLILDPSLPDSLRQLRHEDFWDGLTTPRSAEDRIEISVEFTDFDDNDDHLALLGEHLVQPDPMVARLTYALIPIPNRPQGPTSDGDYEFLIYGGGRPEIRIGYDLRKRLPLELLPALRDAESDLANWRRSPLRPLLDRIAGEMDRESLSSLTACVTEATDAVAQCDEVRSVSQTITEKLLEMVGPAHALETTLGFTPADSDRLIRSLRLFIDGKLRSVADASLGSANILYLALKTLELDHQVRHGDRSHTFLAIEEPEAHLHPHVQRRVYRSFLRPRQPIPTREVANAGRASESTILLTTHSPNIVSVTPVRSFVLLRRSSDGRSTEGVSTATLELESAEVEDIERYLDVSRGEILFARGIILVEGEAEEYMVPVLAELLGINLDEFGISVCSVAGTHFLPYLKFVGPNGLNIPHAVITDSDPAVRTTGLSRIKKLLDYLAQEELGKAGSDVEVVRLGERFGLFLTEGTFEVALFKCGRHKTYARTIDELSSKKVAKRRAAAWKIDHTMMVEKELLLDVEGIGKGRFSQRWAQHIARSKSTSCPQSVQEALLHVVEKLKGLPYQIGAEALRKNPQQWAAYESKGHCVVLAGPGSGKTKVLTLKLARLIAEEVARPRGVACLTYNNECVKELNKRLGDLGIRNSGNVYVGTVHAFCLKAIVLPYGRLAGLQLPERLEVASAAQSNELFGQALLRVVGADEREEAWRRVCARHRRTVLDRDSTDWLGLDPRPARVIERYERLLRDRGLLDFEDMVLIGLRLVESHPWVRRILRARYPVLVVDEYQDLGLPLHRLVLSLCFGSDWGCRLFAVGDYDQSIYSFAGAEPDLLLQVARDEHVERIQLRLNYRSRSRIVEASEVALGEARGYEATSGDGGVIEFYRCKNGLKQQAEVVCNVLIPKALANGSARSLGEIAVLYRDKSLGDIAAEVASAANLQYIRSDANAPYRCTPFTSWLEQLANWCAGGWKQGAPSLSELLAAWRGFNRTTASDTEMLAIRRTLTRFLFAHRDTNLGLKEWLESLHESCLRSTFEREPLTAEDARHFDGILGLCGVGRAFADWPVGRFGGQSGTPSHLNLMTFHSSKGLEFDVVYMIGLDQGIIPGYRETTPASKKEPRRLFYVGLTRARNEVHLLCSGWRDTPYGPKNDGPSEFLLEVYKATQATS